MIKEVVIGLLDQAPNPIVADRYYLRHHGPNIVLISGPWLRGYVSYKAYAPPSEAVERFGAKRGRYTELWFTNMEEYQSRPPGVAFTPPPIVKWHGEGFREHTYRALVPGLPTDKFLVKQLDPEETTILRWVCALEYPHGVSLEEGEKWYTEVHSQETVNQPGLLGFYSYRTLVDETISADNSTRFEDGGPIEHTSWVRVSELWYEDLAAWHKAVIESPPKYTPPPWGGVYPFVEMVSNFIDFKPDVDFLRGNYAIP